MPQSATFSGKRPLTIEGGPRTVTDASFAADVERSPLPVLLDAWAPWCWPCQIIGPVVEEIAIEMAGRLRVGRVNVDENPSTTARFPFFTSTRAPLPAGFNPSAATSTPAV